MLHIYIPSCGRSSFLGTLSHLPKSLLKQTTLVVQHKERTAYIAALTAIEGGEDVKVLVLPPRIKTIAPTRAFIFEYARLAGEQKIVMLDDDLRFDWRRKDDNGKFLVATDQQVLELFAAIKTQLEAYVHVGVLAREGGNRVLQFPAVYNTRMMRVLAYRVDILWRENIKFNRIQLMEDFDVCLQLLRKGYANCVLTEWVQGQGNSGATGGCSHFRTIDLHNDCANKLAKLHPGLVKVVFKQTKGAWGGGIREDVTVQWKKAYNAR